MKHHNDIVPLDGVSQCSDHARVRRHCDALTCGAQACYEKRDAATARLRSWLMVRREARACPARDDGRCVEQLGSQLTRSPFCDTRNILPTAAVNHLATPGIGQACSNSAGRSPRPDTTLPLGSLRKTRGEPRGLRYWTGIVDGRPTRRDCSETAAWWFCGDDGLVRRYYRNDWRRYRHQLALRFLARPDRPACAGARHVFPETRFRTDELDVRFAP
jgi:hypothetical protein